jgi:hypothetical protein
MTNSRSLSWIDRGKWESLLSNATQQEPAAIPSRPARPAAAVAAARPVGPRRTTAAPATVPAIPAIPAPAAAAPAPAAPRTFPPFSPTSDQLEDRLQALVGWIESCVTCRAAFIADDSGLPVVEHLGAEQGHIAAASSILSMLASVRSLMRDSGGWLSLKMSSGVLHVVEVTTKWGRFGIGVVTEDLVPHAFLTALSAAVESAFHGEMQGDAT